MKKNLKFYFGLSTLSALFLFPVVSAAAPLLTSNSTLSDLIDAFLKLLNSLIPVLIGGALVCFLYGVFVFIAKSSNGNADGRKEGINFMIFGVIGLTVMVSIWGLVAFVTTSLGTSSSVLPQFNSSRQVPDRPADVLPPSMRDLPTA